MKTEQINFRLEVEKIEALKNIARKKSLETNKDISYTDLIRSAILDKYFCRK